ncbi:MAG TPA: hypothetical protein PKM59_01040 [Thermodesulfobacteriota bacterium]|nr:hypothetical protein [Thermodesulfobacteriota bacterium]HNU70153.1 hypothetical protein [Thermodesulfobacteriota bacterium]
MKTMKTIVMFLACMMAVLATASASVPADDFLGVPLIPNATMFSRSDTRAELGTSLSHDEAFSFYKEYLEGKEDIQIRDWEKATYIEDDGSLPWHSITIEKQPVQGMTRVTIAKDSWTWIIGTLVLRFIGVFVVLSILYGGLVVSGAILSRVTATDKKK